jgi:hypothetical protein
MAIPSVAHGLVFEGLACWGWRIEDATGLALLSLPHLNTAEDDSGKD